MWYAPCGGETTSWEPIEDFRCTYRCRRQGEGVLDPSARAANCCGLPDFDMSAWTGDATEPTWLGLPPDFSREGQPGWEHPKEDPGEIACPGSWYRSMWVLSLGPYRRPIADGGARVSNLRLERCEDPLVLDAIATLERFEDEVRRETMDRISAHMTARAKAGKGA